MQLTSQSDLVNPVKIHHSNHRNSTPPRHQTPEDDGTIPYVASFLFFLLAFFLFGVVWLCCSVRSRGTSCLKEKKFNLSSLLS